MKATSSAQSCGCCEGIQKLTPMAIANRPGLEALAYRVGTHASFLETMKARLSSLCLGDEEECRGGQGLRPLQRLTTRAGDDPSIAMLDAWATVADVLTFYQERLANEGYLRTATERRSILELARLVGYRLRPGVAASVFLAFELEQGYQVDIPAGTRAQSLPAPGELPQPFETSEAFWIEEGAAFSTVRATRVHAQSERLTLAAQPDTTPIGYEGPDAGKRIELDGLYDGLDTGRWLIVSGERSDLEDASSGEPVPGVRAAELVMLGGVLQGPDQGAPGETPYTVLVLAKDGLAYTYKRDTVTIYANVVKATHGETRQEVLGSGDGGKAQQQFTLKQSPLTYVAAPTPTGTESTLQVYANDVRWHEVQSLVELTPTDRKFTTHTDNDQKTTAIFGDGERGARLPTGLENVKAVYRSGIGKPGNVAAGQISLLATRPLGVKGVVNPLRASGGADAESRDQARPNVPLAVMALDRPVSVQDYADFVRTFAGIGKASAACLSDGRQQLLHLTIAGADDVPIDENSDLYQNLRQALRQYGDPRLPYRIELRELMLLAISARVRVAPDYLWESVEPRIRAALWNIFGFERRQLGQDVLLSEVISAIQRVPGVAYTDVDILDSVPEGIPLEEMEKLAETLKGPEQPKQRITVNLAHTEGTTVYYRIKSGDTLSGIANRFGTTVSELARLNAITNPNLIFAGHSLLIRQGGLKPAQLAYLSPDVPDTLILTELSS